MRKYLQFFSGILVVSLCTMVFAVESNLDIQLKGLTPGTPEYNQVKTDYYAEQDAQLILDQQMAAQQKLEDYNAMLSDQHGPTVVVPLADENSSRVMGDDCTDPIIINIPGDLPFTEFGQTTCGRLNDYSDTCLGSYDGGEDIIYQLDVSEETTIDISMASDGSWTGLSLSAECPGMSCIDYVTGSSGAQDLFNNVLAPGSYYVQIDTWPAPDCLNSFDLTIDVSPPPVAGDTCEDPFVYGNVNDPAVTGAIDSYGANWWTFENDGSFDNVIASLCGSGYDTKIEVWDDCGAVDYIAYNDDSCGLQSEVDLGALAAGTYYVKVYGFSSSYGDYTLSVTGTNYGLSCEDPYSYTNVNDPAVTGSIESYGSNWWEVYNDGSWDEVTFSLCGSLYDTKIEVWDDCGAVDYLAYNDDSCGLQSEVQLLAPAAGYYYVRVFGFSSSFGDYTLSVTGTTAECTDNALTIDMYDSYGDGWNGNMLNFFDDLGNMLESVTLASGTYGQEFICLPDGSYGVTCDGGSWQSEVSWDISDAGGNLLLSGGAPFSGSLGLPVILGCTDWTATNWDPEANTDDGSCVYMDGPWGLTATAGDGLVDLEWHDPAEVPPIIEYHDGVLQNAFYYYDNYDNGFAHGVRFDVDGVYDITAASVKILSEGDAYWPWPNATHGPVRLMVFDDNGGVPGNMIWDEYVTSVDGWATVYPGYTGMTGSFYVIASHDGNWQVEGDPEGFGIDGAVDFPDNMYTLDTGSWYTGDFLGYGGDYMFTAWVGGDYGLQEVSYNNETPPAILGNNNHSSSVHQGELFVDNAPETHPFEFLTTRELVGFDIYRDDVMVGSVGPDVYTYQDVDTFDNFVDYCYYVRAAYDEGPSIPSNDACVIFLGDPPPAPENVMAEGYYDEVENSSGITWSWDWSDGSPEIGAPCGDGMIYDCELYCVDEAIAMSYVGDTFCDDGTWGYYLDCPYFDNDGGDCAGAAAEVTVTIVTDSYPGETSWDLYDASGNYIDGITAGDLFDSYTMYNWTYTLDPGTYTFNVWDAFGDGIYCFQDGYYQLDVDGVTIAGGPGVGCDFGSGASYDFTVGGLLLSSSEWIFSAPVQGEKGLSDYDMSGIDLIETVTYINDVKPYNPVPRTVFNIADGTIQEMNVNRTTVFTLYLTYDGVDYAFTTSDMFIDIIGFENLSYVCGVVTATNDWGQESAPSMEACAESGAPETCDYAPPQDLTVTDTGVSLLLEWTHPDYVDPSMVLGETMANPFIVDQVPFYASGTTVGFMDDYDEVCPYSGSTSADVVYLWDAEPGDWTVDICDSDYDTKIYVYDGNGILLGCTDDSCNAPDGSPFRSDLGLSVLDYGPLYVIVDGYGGNEGNYNLEIYSGLPVLSENEQPVKEDNPENQVVDRECGVTQFNVYLETEDGDCPPGQSMDCDGLCFDDEYLVWIGDGYCDDGAFGINFYCEQWNWDDGDCDVDTGQQGNKVPAQHVTPASRNWTWIASTVYPYYEYTDGLAGCFIVTADDGYLGWNESDPTDPVCGEVVVEVPETPQDVMADAWFDDASGDSYITWSWSFGNTGDCLEGEIPDCNGNCAPESWVGDFSCDDGTFSWNGVPIFFDCAEFNYDNGDCDTGCVDAPYDDDCYFIVIENDPYCCDTEWDSLCEDDYIACMGGDNNEITPDENALMQRIHNNAYLVEKMNYLATHTVFNLADGTQQSSNVNRDVFFTLYLTYQDVDYAFTTSDLFIDVVGFDWQVDLGLEVCGVVTAGEDLFFQESEPSPPACANIVGPEECEYDAPTNVMATGGDNSVLVEWDYAGYEPPEPLDCGDAAIYSLPFNDVNSNVGMTDDWDVSGSDGADFTYALTLNSSTTLTVDLCSALTDYDTKLEIFTADEECAGFTTGFYDDDGPFGSCPDSPAPYTPSLIENAYLDAGNYFVVVDGFGGDEGNFEINIWESGALASEPVDPHEAMAYEAEKSGVDIADLNWNSVDENANRECGVTNFNVYGEFPGDVFSVMILTDDYGSETSWDLYNDDTGMMVAAEGPLESATAYQWDYILDPGNYTWTIYDLYGDGICCSWGEGYYELYMNGNFIAGGGEFEASESVSFNTADGTFAVGQNDYLVSPTWEKGTDGYELEMTNMEIIETGQFPVTENRDFIWVGSTNQLSFEVTGHSEGCFYVTADDNSLADNESDPSEQACSGGCECEPGDFTCDGQINVLDIVNIVSVILNGLETTECEFYYADFTGDGQINVLDIVQIVAIILNPGRTDNAESASLIQTETEMRMVADGFVGGIQMTLNHGDDFSIELGDAWFADYVTTENITRLVIIDAQSDILFTTTGDYEVAEALAATTDGLIDVNISVPMEFNLSQAYPNPFNPTTHLTLEIPADGFVSVQVYNVVGQVVEVLVDNQMTAGYHEITWNAGNIPSGMYFVRSIMGSEVKTQKVMLLK